MSVHLENVERAREDREAHELAFREAVAAAYAAGHSLREIAPYAGMTHAGVRHYVRPREENGE